MSPSVTLPCGEEGRGVGRTTVGGRGVPRKTGPRCLCAAAKCSPRTPSSPRPRRHAGTRLIIQYCSVARVKVTQLLSGILELDPDPDRVVPGHPRTGVLTSAHSAVCGRGRMRTVSLGGHRSVGPQRRPSACGALTGPRGRPLPSRCSDISLSWASTWGRACLFCREPGVWLRRSRIPGAAFSAACSACHFGRRRCGQHVSTSSLHLPLGHFPSRLVSEDLRGPAS